MTIVRFGTICDLCGAGSRDYAHDANRCSFCEEDLCDSCAVFTKHTLVREEDEGQCKRWDCEDRPVHTSRMDAEADAETLRLFARDHHFQFQSLFSWHVGSAGGLGLTALDMADQGEVALAGYNAAAAARAAIFAVPALAEAA